MEEHSKEHRNFFLSIVAIVAVVGIVGLIVMITGYNLPSETQAGQALLREQRITTTKPTETRLPSPLLEKEKIAGKSGKYGSLDVRPQQACVQDSLACVKKLSQIAGVDDQLRIILHDPKTKAITFSDNRGQRATLTMDGSELNYVYFVDQEKTDSRGRQEVSFFVSNKGKARQPLTFFVDPLTLNQIFTGQTQALFGVWPWKHCEDWCNQGGWDTGTCKLLVEDDTCGLGEGPVGTGWTAGCEGEETCCCWDEDEVI